MEYEEWFNFFHVTKKDIDNGIKDEYGVVYSPDGKRLLHVMDVSLRHYDVKEGCEILCEMAFYDCAQLESIKLPDSITIIGCGALSCESLKSVTIPPNVQYVNSAAFNPATKIISESTRFMVADDCLIDNDQDRLIVCFANKRVVNIPDNVRVIGNVAFRFCKNTEQITLPKTVTNIEKYAFKGCERLRSIAIPGHASLGARPFNNCPKLCDIKIISDGDDSALVFTNGMLIDQRMHNLICFICTPKLESIVKVPDGVTHIGDNAFADSCLCHCDITIKLPKGLTNIGDYAFSGVRIQSISIPNTVTHIGAYAFHKCKWLRTISLPESVKTIGESAFQGCAHLKSITLPSDATITDDDLYCGWFEECEDLEEINITQIDDKPSLVFINGMLIDQRKHMLLACLHHGPILTIPEGVTSFDIFAFRVTIFQHIKHVHLPEGLSSFCDIFGNWPDLVSISVPNSHVYISEEYLKKRGLTVTIRNNNNGTASDGCDEITMTGRKYLRKYKINNRKRKQDSMEKNKRQYFVEKIESFEQINAYIDYIPDWCICIADEAYREYTADGSTIFLCLRNNFRRQSIIKTTSYPLDDYGLSAICVIVSPEQKITNITTRWNDYSDNSMAMSPSELESLIGKDNMQKIICKPQSEGEK